MQTASIKLNITLKKNKITIFAVAYKKQIKQE